MCYELCASYRFAMAAFEQFQISQLTPLASLSSESGETKENTLPRSDQGDELLFSLTLKGSHKPSSGQRPGSVGNYKHGALKGRNKRHTVLPQSKFSEKLKLFRSFRALIG